MEQEEKLSLDFGNGEIYEVWLEVATYPADKNIKVCVFTEKEEEIWKLFELTTDMGIPLEKNQTFLLPGYDLEQIVEFIKKNAIGQLKEEICCSGCMEYPLFEFQEETLKKLDPEGYAAYEQAYQGDEGGRRTLPGRVHEDDVGLLARVGGFPDPCGGVSGKESGIFHAVVLRVADGVPDGVPVHFHAHHLPGLVRGRQADGADAAVGVEDER